LVNFWLYLFTKPAISSFEFVRKASVDLQHRVLFTLRVLDATRPEGLGVPGTGMNRNRVSKSRVARSAPFLHPLSGGFRQSLPRRAELKKRSFLDDQSCRRPGLIAPSTPCVCMILAPFAEGACLCVCSFPVRASGEAGNDRAWKASRSLMNHKW
jgi:hypothetical protein